MKPVGDAPPRVLVVWCPDWPDQGAEGAQAFEQVVAAVEELCPRVGKTGSEKNDVRIFEVVHMEIA